MQSLMLMKLKGRFEKTKKINTVITLNRRDFQRLHRANSLHSGIITCTDDAVRRQLAQRIDAAIAVEPSLQGKLVRFSLCF
jgi:hypothetical protein